MNIIPTIYEASEHILFDAATGNKTDFNAAAAVRRMVFVAEQIYGMPTLIAVDNELYALPIDQFLDATRVREELGVPLSARTRAVLATLAALASFTFI